MPHTLNNNHCVLQSRFPHLQQANHLNLTLAHNTYYCSVTNLVLIYITTPLTMLKADKYNRQYFTNLFSEYSNLLLIFPNNKKVFTAAKLKAYRKAGVRCEIISEYEKKLHQYIIKHYPIALPSLVTPNSAWIGDKGSNIEAMFHRQTAYAIPCGDKYTKRFRHLTHNFGAHSDAYSPITGDYIEIKSRGLNTLDTYEECLTKTEKLSAIRYQKFQTLWYSWSHNHHKHKSISSELSSRYIILFPDNAFVCGDVSTKDIERMEKDNIRYNSFSDYNLEVNNVIKRRINDINDRLPDRPISLVHREKVSIEEAITEATKHHNI
ncbi:MAG: hypothetical protein VX100_02575 [Pseudomonadota bacterium]|nr:hypothetical protein [Pseudomonadota bacterium]